MTDTHSVSAREDASSRLAWLSDPNPLVRWGGRAWLLLGLLLVGWALWHLAGILRLVIVPLVLALFPAGILMPVVDWLDDHGWRRGVAVFVVELGFVAAVLGVLFLLGWQVSQQLSGLAEQLRSSYTDLRSSFGSPSWLPSDPSLSSMLGSSGGGGGGGASGGLGSVVVFGQSLMEIGAQALLGVVTLFFYLRDDQTFSRFVVRLFPTRLRDDAVEIGRRSWEAVTAYIRGQTIVAIVDGLLFAVGLLIIGVPLPWVLGAIVAIGAYVPVVGSIVAGALGVLVALITGGVTAGLLALALIVGVQQLEGHVIAPYVLGRELKIHPLTVIVAVTTGAAVLGPFGALIGVPLAASLNQAASYVRDDVG